MQVYFSSAMSALASAIRSILYLRACCLACACGDRISASQTIEQAVCIVAWVCLSQWLVILAVLLHVRLLCSIRPGGADGLAPVVC